jgi:hypothetical protein
MQLVENWTICDVFATEIGKVERVSDSCNRFYLCVRQDADLVVVAKVIIPTECFPRWNEQRERLMAQAGIAPHSDSGERVSLAH